MRHLMMITVSTAALFAAACTPADQTTTASPADTSTTTETTETVMSANPLLAEWTGPFGGVPNFDTASLDDLKPALEEGMALNLAEIDAIANNPEPASFENTIVAMERAGEPLGNVFRYWGIWSSNMSTPEFRAIQAEMAPRLSAFSSQITQNAALFARVRAVYEGDEMASLRPDQQRLVQLTYDGFARNGATLEGAAAERYAAIDQRLSELYTAFSSNLLHDEENYVHYISADQLSGLPDGFVQASAAAATARGHEGEYAITNTRSSMDPDLLRRARSARNRLAGLL